MRDWLFALLFLSFALVCACSDTPAVAARRSIAKTTALLQVADAGFKTNTKQALELVAARHRAETLARLVALGCAASTSQPASAPMACQVAADQGRNEYLAASRELAAIAAKVDASISAAYSAILLAVVTVGELDAGIGSIKSLGDAIARAGVLVAAAVAVYSDFKLILGK